MEMIVVKIEEKRVAKKDKNGAIETMEPKFIYKLKSTGDDGLKASVESPEALFSIGDMVDIDDSKQSKLSSSPLE